LHFKIRPSAPCRCAVEAIIFIMPELRWPALAALIIRNIGSCFASSQTGRRQQRFIRFLVTTASIGPSSQAMRSLGTSKMKTRLSLARRITALVSDTWLVRLVRHLFSTGFPALAELGL